MPELVKIPDFRMTESQALDWNQVFADELMSLYDLNMLDAWAIGVRALTLLGLQPEEWSNA